MQPIHWPHKHRHPDPATDALAQRPHVDLRVSLLAVGRRNLIQLATRRENVHVSNSETLSPSTSIFTTLSFSTFTTNGQVRSTAVPVVSTSVTLVPVPVPTTTSAQNASR